jgi:hypothetical protein
MDVDEQLPMDFSLSDQDADHPQPDAVENILEQGSQPDPNLTSSGANSEGISDLNPDQQTQLDTINRVPSSDHSETPIYAPDAGCQELDGRNAQESSGEGELLGSGDSNEQINGEDVLNFDELSESIQIEDVKIGVEFVRALQAASLDDEHMQLDPETLDRL